MDFNQFNLKRRQQFMSHEMSIAIEEMIKNSIQKLAPFLATLERTNSRYHGTLRGDFYEKLNLIRLKYTNGDELESLRPILLEAIDAFHVWCIEYDSWFFTVDPEADRSRVHVGFDFENQLEYHSVITLLSLAYLFNEKAAIQKIMPWFVYERGRDVIFEELIRPMVSDPIECDGFYYEELYDLLLGAIWEDGDEGVQCMHDFLKNWYPNYEGMPWIDGHLRVGKLEHAPHWAPYYGYWAFEAAAFAVMWKLDDSSYRDHLLYPKDLADFARAQRAVEPATAIPNIAIHSRCPANDLCPQSGYWFTLAKANSRTHFKQGDVMPDFPDSSYGATIWYWDQNQG
jgi:hypothetical protein